MLKGAELKAILGAANLNSYHSRPHDLDVPNAKPKDSPRSWQTSRVRRSVWFARARGSNCNSRFSRKAGRQGGRLHFCRGRFPEHGLRALASKQVDANISFDRRGAVRCSKEPAAHLFVALKQRNRPRLSAQNGASANMFVRQETIDTERARRRCDGRCRPRMRKHHPRTAELRGSAQQRAKLFQFDMARGDEVLDAALTRALPSYRASISRSRSRP